MKKDKLPIPQELDDSDMYDLDIERLKNFHREDGDTEFVKSKPNKMDELEKENIKDLPEGSHPLYH